MLNAKQEKEFQEMVQEGAELMEQEKIAKAFIEAEDVAGQSEPQMIQRVKTAPGINGEVKRFGSFREEFNGIPFTDGEPEPQTNLISKPSHYNFFGEDTMPTLEKILGTEGYLGFLKGNALKYRFRAGKKKGNSIEQDIAKAVYYEDLYNNFTLENTPS